MKFWANVTSSNSFQNAFLNLYFLSRWFLHIQASLLPDLYVFLHKSVTPSGFLLSFPFYHNVTNYLPCCFLYKKNVTASAILPTIRLFHLPPLLFHFHTYSFTKYVTASCISLLQLSIFYFPLVMQREMALMRSHCFLGELRPLRTFWQHSLVTPSL